MPTAFACTLERLERKPAQLSGSVVFFKSLFSELFHLSTYIIMRKKSVKKYIKEGCIIRTGVNQFYEVTAVLENKFQCKNLDFIGSDFERTQEFYYNIDMVILHEVARNC